MTTMFKVQSGVPLPDVSKPKQPRRKFPVEGMQPGQMFFVPGKSSRSVSSYVSRITKDLPGRYTARHCWMVRDANGDWQLCEESGPPACEGVGVWRHE